MASIVTAPDGDPPYINWGKVTLFLAGGISGCDDWQRYAAERLKFELPDHVVIYNPRRDGDMDPTHEPSAREQIKWEYDALGASDIVVFWFPAGGPNPIALFELGKELTKRMVYGNPMGGSIYVGCDPGNARALDITIQSELMYPELQIFTDLPKMLDDLVFQFKK